MRNNYYSVWKTFNEFFIKLDVKPAKWSDRLTLCIGYLIDQKKVQPQTVRSYISAIKTVLRSDGIEISEDSYLLSLLVRACKLKNSSVRTRLPIQKNLLFELLAFTEQYYLLQNQPYLASLFKTLFITTYFGLFRVSELCMTSSQHAVRVTDVHIGKNKRKFLFILWTSKTHDRSSKPQMIKISMHGEGSENKTPAKTGERFCPYEELKNFSEIIPEYHNPQEQFFVFRDYSPVTAMHMRSTLHLMLKLMKYDPGLYSSHSFRAGRSTDMLKYGLSVETIKKLGRWKTNIIFSYLH